VKSDFTRISGVNSFVKMKCRTETGTQEGSVQVVLYDK
jgi:hypothetical protein